MDGRLRRPAPGAAAGTSAVRAAHRVAAGSTDQRTPDGVRIGGDTGGGGGGGPARGAARSPGRVPGARAARRLDRRELVDRGVRKRVGMALEWRHSTMGRPPSGITSNGVGRRPQLDARVRIGGAVRPSRGAAWRVRCPGGRRRLAAAGAGRDCGRRAAGLRGTGADRGRVGLGRGGGGVEAAGGGGERGWASHGTDGRRVACGCPAGGRNRARPDLAPHPGAACGAAVRPVADHRVGPLRDRGPRGAACVAHDSRASPSFSSFQRRPTSCRRPCRSSSC